MARRPAYNTKAERQRRLEQREETFAAALAEGDVSELFVPVFRAWFEFRRSVREYETLHAEPFRSADVSDHVSVARIRDMTWVGVAAALSYGALITAAASMANEAERAATKAGLMALTLAPYTAEEEQAIGLLSPPRDA